MSPFPVEIRGSRTAILLGDLVAGQRLEVVLGIRFGYGPIGSEVGVLIGVTDRDGAERASRAEGSTYPAGTNVSVSLGRQATYAGPSRLGLRARYR